VSIFNSSSTLIFAEMDLSERKLAAYAMETNRIQQRDPYEGLSDMMRVIRGTARDVAKRMVWC